MLTFALSDARGRYLVVGAICAVANNVILIGGDAAGLHYAAALLLTFLLVLPASYVAHAWWTFMVPASWSAFIRFLAGSISSLIIATITIGTLCGLLRLPMIIAAPVATVAMIVYNFVMTRWAVRHRAKANVDPFRPLSERDPDDIAEAA